MIDSSRLVDGVIRGVLGGRRKRSRKALRYLVGGRGGLLANPNALLTVAGVAWGVFETLQHQGTSVSTGTTGPVVPPPIPGTWNGEPGTTTPPTAVPIPPDALRIVRLAIAAAHADGTLGDTDRAAILEHARAAGAEHLVEHEIRHRHPLADVVAGITDPAERATLYVLAFTVVRADEGINGAERIFLAQLANLLGLDPETVTRLEAEASTRIDAQE